MSAYVVTGISSTNGDKGQPFSPVAQKTLQTTEINVNFFNRFVDSKYCTRTFISPSFSCLQVSLPQPNLLSYIRPLCPTFLQGQNVQTVQYTLRLVLSVILEDNSFDLLIWIAWIADLIPSLLLRI